MTVSTDIDGWKVAAQLIWVVPSGGGVTLAELSKGIVPPTKQLSGRSNGTSMGFSAGYTYGFPLATGRTTVAIRGIAVITLLSVVER